MKEFAISFKGGMARGLGCIGLVRFLQEENLIPKYYAGSSSGALVASAFAMNYTWEQILEGFSKVRIINLISINSLFSKGSIISRTKFLKTLSQFLNTPVEAVEFKDMPNKLFLFASSLKDRERIIIHRGNLGDALVESCSYPLILERRIEHPEIIDGDFTSSFSAGYLRHKGAEVVIGCEYKPKKSSLLSLNPVNTLISTYRLVSDQIDKYSDQIDPVDFDLRYNADDVSYMDFKKISILAERVYNRAKAHSDEIHKLLK